MKHRDVASYGQNRAALSSTLFALLLGVSACSEGLSRIRVRAVDSVVHYPATGGVVVSTSRKPDAKAICVAPPAQGALNVELNIKHDGKVDVLKYVEVETQNALDLSKSLAKLYDQNERTLFLQFSLYRLCEAYANGMLDEETFAETMAFEAAKLSQAAAEAATRLTEATEEQQRAEEERKKHQQTFDDGKAALEAAEVALATAKEDPEPASRSRPEKPENTIRLEQEVEKAKKRLADPDWQQAASAVRKAEIAAAKVEAAKSEKKSLETSFKYVSNLAAQAQSQENIFIGKKEDAFERRQRLSRKNYAILFREVLKTAETLSTQQVEIARAEAEKAKAEAEKAKQAAEKAKAEAEKAKAGEELKKTEAKFEALQDKLVDAAVSRVGGCSDKCQTPEAGTGEETSKKSKQAANGKP